MAYRKRGARREANLNNNDRMQEKIDEKQDSNKTQLSDKVLSNKEEVVTDSHEEIKVTDEVKKINERRIETTA